MAPRPENKFITHESDHLDGLVEGEPIGETDPRIRGGRTGSRAAVIQALYESDASGHPAVISVKRLGAERALKKEDIDFATRLVKICENQRNELDSEIARMASQYPSDQMAPVDRNILRVALAELEMPDAAPEKVVVNEAVEMATLFGSDSSQKFVNGVLGALLG